MRAHLSPLGHRPWPARPSMAVPPRTLSLTCVSREPRAPRYKGEPRPPARPNPSAAFRITLHCAAAGASRRRRRSAARVVGVEFRRSKATPPWAPRGRAAPPKPLPIAGGAPKHHHPVCPLSCRPSRLPAPSPRFRPLPSVSHAGEHIIAIPFISSLRFASHPSP
jgi:hypothetical protein